MNEGGNADSANVLVSCTARLGKADVNYFYKNIHKYEEFLHNGIGNPEDCFNTSTVLHIGSAAEDIKAIVSMMLTRNPWGF